MKRPQQKASIGGKEMTAMLTILVASHSFLNYPRFASVAGGEAAWMEPILGALVTIVTVLILDVLFRRYFKDLGLVEVFRLRLGPVWTGLLCLIFALFFLVVTASIMREFMENVITTVLPNTPIFVVGGLFVASIAYVAFCGLEGIARIAFLALPVFVIGIFSLCAMTANWWKPEFLLPIWGSGPGSVIWGSLASSSVFTNVVVLCLLRMHAHDPKDFRGVGIRSTIYATIVLMVFLLVYHMVFTPEETAKLTSPMYSLARVIHLGRFVQRLESVFIFMWVSAAVVKMSITLWCAAYCLGVGFGWPIYRPILPALAVLCLAGSLLPSDMASMVDVVDSSLMRWSWVVAFVLPLLSLWVASLRRTKRRVV